MNPTFQERRTISTTDDLESSIAQAISGLTLDTNCKDYWSPLDTVDNNFISQTNSFIPFSAFLGLNSNQIDFEVSHTNMLNSEQVGRIYKEEMLLQEHIRTEVFKASTELTKYFQYSHHTRYLSLSYIDAVLAKYSIIPSQIIVLGYCSLILAAKLEENYQYLPRIEKAMEILRNVDSKEAIFHYERYIFETIGFNTNLKTPFAFLNLFLQKGVVTENEISEATGEKSRGEFEDTFQHLSLFFLEAAVQRYHFNKYRSSVVAASVIFLTRGCLGLKGLTPSLEKHIRCNWHQINECVSFLLNLTKFNNHDFARKFTQAIKEVEKEIHERNNPSSSGASIIEECTQILSQKSSNSEQSSESDRKTGVKKRIARKSSKTDVKNFRSNENKNFSDLNETFGDISLTRTNSMRNPTGHASSRRAARKSSK